MASRSSPETNVACRIPTDWGAVAVVEMFGRDAMLAKAVQVPYPSMIRINGILVPERRGEVHLPNGERFHRIDWRDIITGGGKFADRRHIQINGITAIVIPPRNYPDEYNKLLYGRGLLFR
ncbi:MAG: hypothetical protein PHV63_03515 [Candidatus Daviesbacteria bacterium]|nr:hypothetical protein [Candidatus Daviesbacteria bacterium]